MLELRTLILATDFSESAELAAIGCAQLAARLQADVHVVNVIEQLGAYRHRRINSSDEAPALLRMGVEESLRHLSDLACRHFSGLPSARIHLRLGSPVQEVLQAARDAGADLLITGTQSRGPLTRLMRGSVAERLVCESPIPVLSLQEPLVAGPERPVLVAVNFSSLSPRAVQLAGRLAAGLGTSVVLLSVLEPPRAGALWTHRPAESAEVARTRVLERLDALARAELPTEVACQCLALVGIPREAIAETVQAQNACLLIIGTHRPESLLPGEASHSPSGDLEHMDPDVSPGEESEGARRLSRLILGDVAIRVLRTCRTPLLTCR